MLLLLVVIIIIFCLIKLSYKPTYYPPGPTWLPFVGSLLAVNKLIKKKKCLHSAFEELADSYKTSILGLKLGRENVVVVFKEFSTKVLLNQAFDGRPDNFFLRLRTMGLRKGITGVDGSLWETHRIFILKTLKDCGYGKSYMNNYISEELRVIIDDILRNKESVDITALLSPSILNMLWMFLAGKPLDKNNYEIGYLQTLMRKRSEAFDFSGGILNQIPWLRFIAPEITGYNLIKEVNNNLHKLFTSLILDHKETAFDDENLVSAYIREINKGTDTFTEEQLLMVCFDFFIAGSLTTSELLNLIFLAMLKYPEVQEKVYNEIELVIGQRTVQMDDIAKLPYTRAVLLEIERYYCIMNIIGPRRAMADVALDKYIIPKGTTVLISVKSVHNNANLWFEPDKFNPDRFLDADTKALKYDNIMTFGTGRRRCLGESLAKNCVFLFFCGILQKYRVEPVDGVVPSDKLQNGILSKALPYRVKFITRK